MRRIEPRDGGGYEVTYADLGEHPGEPADVELTCDHLILSAGTLGTTNLLLKQPQRLPRALAQARHAASAATATC